MQLSDGAKMTIIALLIVGFFGSIYWFEHWTGTKTQYSLDHYGCEGTGRAIGGGKGSYPIKEEIKWGHINYTEVTRYYQRSEFTDYYKNLCFIPKIEKIKLVEKMSEDKTISCTDKFNPKYNIEYEDRTLIKPEKEICNIIYKNDSAFSKCVPWSEYFGFEKDEEDLMMEKKYGELMMCLKFQGS